MKPVERARKSHSLYMHNVVIDDYWLVEGNPQEKDKPRLRTFTKGIARHRFSLFSSNLLILPESLWSAHEKTRDELFFFVSL